MVWILVITGILGVFLGLLILCVFLLIVQKIAVSGWKRTKQKKALDVKIGKGEISGEIAAAAAVSIYLNSRRFKEQKKLLTIQKVTKPFSPWINSGKIQMITEWNNVYNRNR
jgi:hypothetical protein